MAVVVGMAEHSSPCRSTRNWRGKRPESASRAGIWVSSTRILTLLGKKDRGDGLPAQRRFSATILTLPHDRASTGFAPHLPFARLWWPLARMLSGEAAKLR